MLKVWKQRQIKDLVNRGFAEDITNGDNETRKRILEIEGGYDIIRISHGVNGTNGLVLQGWNTNNLYAICKRSTAIFIFG